MILIKSENEIEKMRRAGSLLARLLDDYIPNLLKDGISGYDVEKYVNEYIAKHGGTASFKGYHEYPYAICFSVNEEVIHGFPTKKKVLKNGDMVSIDIGFSLDGYIADSARTYKIGNISDVEQKLMDITKQSLYDAIKIAVAGNRVGDIGNAVQTLVEENGFSVIRDFVGHGVGRKLHEDPQIPNFGSKGKGPLLRKNMTIAIEPMVAIGDYNVEVLEDGWTVVTADNSKTAHFEHTLLITDNEPEILTSL